MLQQSCGHLMAHRISVPKDALDWTSLSLSLPTYLALNTAPKTITWNG